ncbi:MAG: SAM-dependent methyltransferase [Odoribacter sp.]
MRKDGSSFIGLSPELKAFIRMHFADDPERLLLSASRYPEMDVPFAIDQIIARRQIREKLPVWFAEEEIVFPSRLSTEQCSSENTARYKQGLLRGECFCDLTGGLGVDTFYLAQKAKKGIYVERFTEYCAAAEHNFKVLGAGNIQVMQGNAEELAGHLSADTFYLDPARRAKDNKRVFALTDCEPDVVQLKSLLLERCRRMIVKVSPMADVEETLRLLPETSEVHVVSVRNECKELLFVLDPAIRRLDDGEVRICAVNLRPEETEQCFSFIRKEEKVAELQTATEVKRFLYEPHAALLKSGAFKLIACRLGVEKLHQHSHLYTSDRYCADFPGRSFTVDRTVDFSGRLLKELKKEIPQANLSTRNFPITVAEFRKRSGIKDGGAVYLFATTLSCERRVVIECHKAERIAEIR